MYCKIPIATIYLLINCQQGSKDFWSTSMSCKAIRDTSSALEVKKVWQEKKVPTRTHLTAGLENLKKRRFLEAPASLQLALKNTNFVDMNICCQSAYRATCRYFANGTRIEFISVSVLIFFSPSVEGRQLRRFVTSQLMYLYRCLLCHYVSEAIFTQVSNITTDCFHD